MKRTISTLLAIAAGLTLATTGAAQGRHDEKPHGYDAKVAAQQSTNTANTTTHIALPSGPRAQDNPLRGKRIEITQPRKEQLQGVESAPHK
jgi:hypothetical protein